uniref:Uncharacterized protein n=1 Tax=Parascaris univalens TaxID=6257 RepID=A0A914ZTR7_PARUN
TPYANSRTGDFLGTLYFQPKRNDFIRLDFSNHQIQQCNPTLANKHHYLNVIATRAVDLATNDVMNVAASQMSGSSMS